MADLSLSLLGPFQVTLDGQPITGFKSSKVRALLAYLAVEADQPHPREVLADLLWPDWPHRDALSNLRYALSNLRSVIGDRSADPARLLITRETLQFNVASDHWLDVSIFAQRIEGHKGDGSAVEQLEQAVALYRGPFLDGFTVDDSPVFEEWALLARQRYDRVMSSALQRLAASLERQGNYQQAQFYARRQLELEPEDEAAHQALMRTLALDGQRSAALAQFTACCRLLDEELGVEPAETTRRLYEQIRDGKLKAPGTTRGAPPVADHIPAFLEEQRPSGDTPVFVAREHELAQLTGLLDLCFCWWTTCSGRTWVRSACSSTWAGTWRAALS